MTRAFALALMAATGFACAGGSVQPPEVLFDQDGCSSSEVSGWPTSSPIDIAVINESDAPTAVVMGTYRDGYSHSDLAAYGRDVSTRPDFIEALEIFQIGPRSEETLSFDPGQGTFFMVCMPDQNTMVVLDDLVLSR